MPNPYYSYSNAFIPGTLARAEPLAAEFSAVAAGFAILAIQGVDTGAANAYVVTTTGGKDGLYSDGMIVEFKAVNANTGPSTIAVDGGSTAGLTSSGGQSLAGGAITAGTWYRAMYNSTYSAFTIIAPTSTVITSNTISSAPPTHLVGLTPAGGVSTACAPIDVTFAIDQSIAPTWTGAHTFANTVTFNSTVTFAGGLGLTGGSSQYAATLTGSPSAGHSLGLEVNAGVNASDIAFLVNNQSGGTQFFEINGVGGVTVGAPTGGSQGVGTINAAGLFVNGAAVKTTSISSANPTASVGLAAVNGTALTFMTSDSAPALNQAITPTMTGAWTFTPSSAVTAVTINAAVNAVGMALVGGTNTVLGYLLTIATGQGSGFSSGVSLKAGTTSADNALLIQNAAATATYLQLKGDGSGSIGYNGSAATIAFAASGAVSIPAATAAVSLTVLGTANQYAILAKGSSTSGQSYGLTIQAGTTSADFALQITNEAVSASYFQVRGDGKILGGGPVAGAPVDMTPDAATFTMTYTGFTAANTATARFARNGNMVTLFFPVSVAASNATTFTATGLPASIQPTVTQVFVMNDSAGIAPLFKNNSAGVPNEVGVSVTAGSGTVTFGNGALAGGWTAGGTTKGVATGFSITYLLN